MSHDLPSATVPSDFDAPNWDRVGKCHDWKTHVSHKVRVIWSTFSDRQKRDLAEGFQQLADQEQWD